MEQLVCFQSSLNYKVDLKEAHGVASTSLEEMFSVLKKCCGKMDCLIHEMLFIRERKPKLNTQSDSIRAKLFI